MRCDSFKILALFLALLPTLAMAAEQTMGRLFFTPEQRARMDVARQQERSIRFDVEREDSAPPANLTLNGVITRSDGKTTVWINNKEQSGDKLGPGITVQGKGGIHGQVSVISPDATRSVPLKVGQSMDMSSGQVADIYRRPLPVPVAGKETPPVAAPAAEKSPALPRRQDEALDAPVDAQGETALPR